MQGPKLLTGPDGEALSKFYSDDDGVTLIRTDRGKANKKNKQERNKFLLSIGQ